MMANKPIASHNAKPNNASWTKRASFWGFLLTDNSKPANTIPIPAPAPTTPIVAKPAPINLPAVNIKLSMCILIIFCVYKYKLFSSAHYCCSIVYITIVFSTLKFTLCCVFILLLYSYICKQVKLQPPLYSLRLQQVHLLC